MLHGLVWLGLARVGFAKLDLAWIDFASVKVSGGCVELSARIGLVSEADTYFLVPLQQAVRLEVMFNLNFRYCDVVDFGLEVWGQSVGSLTVTSSDEDVAEALGSRLQFFRRGKLLVELGEVELKLQEVSIVWLGAALGGQAAEEQNRSGVNESWNCLRT